MSILYIASFQPRAGKTAVALALAQWLAGQGKPAAYCKPVSLSPAQPDPDAVYAAKTLGLKADAPSLVGAALSPAMAMASPDAAVAAASQAASRAQAERPTVIAEGFATRLDDLDLSPLSQRIAAALQAKTVVVVKYDRRLTPQDVAARVKALGGQLAGVIINQTPGVSLRLARTDLAPYLESQGIKVLGVLPESRMLLAPSVGDIAAHLGGAFLAGKEGADALVGHLMIGALSLDPGEAYFSLHKGKAVITRGDRPDIQWSAMDTTVRCMVLTQGKPPIAYVQDRAEKEGIPLIQVQQDTLQTADQLESLVASPTVYHARKVARMQELLAEHGILASLEPALA